VSARARTAALYDEGMTEGSTRQPDTSIWARCPELILVWIVWAVGPGVLVAARLVSLVHPGYFVDPPDIGAFYVVVFGHFVSAVLSLGLVFGKGPHRRLPEFWVLVGYWVVVGLLLGGAAWAMLAPALILSAAIPAAAAIRLARHLLIGRGRPPPAPGARGQTA
jgi:hypothetical protein